MINWRFISNFTNYSICIVIFLVDYLHWPIFIALNFAKKIRCFYNNILVHMVILIIRSIFVLLHLIFHKKNTHFEFGKWLIVIVVSEKLWTWPFRYCRISFQSKWMHKSFQFQWKESDMQRHLLQNSIYRKCTEQANP